MKCLFQVQMVILVVTVLCSVSSFHGGFQKSPKENPFILNGTVLEAVENGPLILRGTLRYRGTKPIYCYRDLQFSNIAITVPQGWKWLFHPRGVNGPAACGIELKPGDAWSETLYLHEHYESIPQGRAELRLSWNVIDGEPPHRVIASPTTALVVDISPASAKNLARLRRRLEKRLRNGDKSRQEWEDLLCTIRYTKHHALYSVVMELLEHPECTEVPFTSSTRVTSLRDLIALAYDCSEKPEKTHTQLVNLALDPRWGRARRFIELFGYWRSERIDLPAAEFQRLTASDNLWSRILLYEAFPRCSNDAWTAVVLRELRDLARPIPANQFAQLLRDLGDDSFRVRETASAKLEQLGERVESQLHQTLHTALSPEAKQRVRFILERIAAAEKAPEWKPILEHLSLGNCDKNAARAILRALAQGRPDAKLTKAALASLNKLSTSKRGNPDGQR